MSHPTSQPTSFPISDAFANGFELTLSQFPTKESERVAARVANYLKTNYNIEFPGDGADTPLAKRRAVHVTGPSPMLRLIAKKENHELIEQLNNMVDKMYYQIDQTTKILNQNSNLHMLPQTCGLLRITGNNISLDKNKKQVKGFPGYSLDQKDCITWNNALSIVCEGCIEPIFDKALDGKAQSEQRDRLYTLLDKLEKIRPDKHIRIECLRYLVMNNYYNMNSKQNFSSLIMEDFINHDDFNVFYSTLNLLFECCNFKPKNPLNPLSDKVLEAINNA